MSENTTIPAPPTAEIVEELLRQLVDARFVLTDRDGAVTRWSRPAEELFGWPGARMLGRQLSETLGLEGPLPRNGGVVQTTARRKSGAELEVTLTMVPVGMSQSLEFNGFLEALEIAAPRGNALQQLGQSHRTVIDWVNAALRGEAVLEDEDLAAGTIVAFRPLVEPAPEPPVREEDEEEREQAALEQAQREEGTRRELDELRAGADATAARVDELGRLLTEGLAGLREELTELRAAMPAPSDAEELSEHAKRLDEAVSAAERAEAAAEQARDMMEGAADLASRAEQAAVTSSHAPPEPEGLHRPLFDKRDNAPVRDARPGFDDVPDARAIIETDGRFRELNPAFSDLVGYSEAEFKAAVWPPVMDRANLQKHRDQMKEMLAGRTDSVPVQTAYVHAQGLLVPVAGTLTMVREDGEPSHFLLQASTG